MKKLGAVKNNKREDCIQNGLKCITNLNHIFGLLSSPPPCIPPCCRAGLRKNVSLKVWRNDRNAQYIPMLLIVENICSSTKLLNLRCGAPIWIRSWRVQTARAAALSSSLAGSPLSPAPARPSSLPPAWRTGSVH